MNIVKSYPPNYSAIQKALGSKSANTVFTYGDTIYSPSSDKLPEHLLRHEETHGRQQSAIGVDEWWNKYLAEPGFRLSQETEAYRAQYASLVGRASRRNILPQLAQALSGGLYGLLITKAQARALIEEE